MHIFIEGVGPLKEYLGDDTHEVVMTPDAVVADLYPLIAEYWGTNLPPHLWNSEKQKFRGAVVVVINGTPVQDLNRKLNHGDHIQLVKALTGG